MAGPLTATERARSKKTMWMVALGLGVLALAVLLVVQLRSAPAPETPPSREVRRGALVGASDGFVARAPAPVVADAAVPIRSAPVDDARAPAPLAASQPSSQPAPPRVQVSAPAVVPEAITRETDPVKRARLLREHALDTARIALSLTRSSIRRLEGAIEANRGSWSAHKLAAARAELERLKQTVPSAEAAVQKAQKEAGQ